MKQRRALTNRCLKHACGAGLLSGVGRGGNYGPCPVQGSGTRAVSAECGATENQRRFWRAPDPGNSRQTVDSLMALLPGTGTSSMRN